MTPSEIFDYWLDVAEYDLATAEAMHQTKRWLYVTFMCQQAIEKLVKGLYVLYEDENVPRTHNIRLLVQKIADKLPEDISEERYRFFDRLTAFYLEGRYPEHSQKLSELVHEPESEQVLSEAKEVFRWLMTLKP